jgi:hypothetical protein
MWSTALLALSSVSRAHDDVLLRWICERGGGSAVRVATHDGVRGLVMERAARPGDVLLEVPLSLTISDIGDGSQPPLPGSAPAWTSGLPWNVQLALALLERREDVKGSPDPFLESWPSEPPPLPSRCEADELALACDPKLATKASEAYFWLDEQYWLASEALKSSCTDQLETTSEISRQEFRDTLELVWSRCLQLSAGDHGKRRLLVPYLDLANHANVPSAMYAFASGATGGPAIRLHAARALKAGEPVTITYGEHTNTHFALYYGFVPHPNPFDAVEVTLKDVLSVLPSQLTGPAPEDGWDAAIDALEGSETLEGASAHDAFNLYAAGPAAPLWHALVALLPPGSATSEAAAAKALSLTAAAIEDALWGPGASAASDAGIAADQKLLDASDKDSEELSARAELLVRLRQSRRWLLASLRQEMDRVAEDGGLFPELLAVTPALYPILDELPIEELTSWETRKWDWERQDGGWAAPKA